MLDTTCAEPQRHGSLTIFPLVTSSSPALPYLLLADALRTGDVTIDEVGSGTVPHLLAINSSERDVLVLDGEQLIGAKQNRTTNRSLILPASSETVIPVSCMEQGRWNWKEGGFSAGGQSSPAMVRRRVKEVEAALAQQGEDIPVRALADAQMAVWSSIADYSSTLQVSSPTGALDEVHAARDADFNGWLADFPALPDQVGLAAFVGRDPVGLDVIGSKELFAAVHPRLVRGYIADAMAFDPANAAPVETPDPQSFLRGVRSARRISAETVGKGQYSTLTGGVIGGELVDVPGLVHLSAFPLRQARRGTSADEMIAPPSQRRRT